MRERILIVDDAPDFGLLLQRIMPGFEVRQEQTATAALAVAYFWKPSLFILDLRLPDMKGTALAQVIREDERLREIPIIYISASLEPDEDGCSPGRHDGCCAFGKPFDLRAFRECVETVLACKRDRAAAETGKDGASAPAVGAGGSSSPVEPRRL